MAANRVFGKIEYGFQEALQKLADSMKDASAIVGGWKDICTSDRPTITFTMSDGDHEVMTLAGVKESLNAWVNKTTGTLVRTLFKAGGSSNYAALRETRLTFSHLKANHLGGQRVPSYRSLGAFADVIDVYRLSHVEDTDYFTSLFELPRVLEANLGVATTAVGDARVHKVAIRSTPSSGSFPDGREAGPATPLATEFLIHNALSSPITVEFYSGADFGQKVATVQVPGAPREGLHTAQRFLCYGAAGAPVSIAKVG